MWATDCVGERAREGGEARDTRVETTAQSERRAGSGQGLVRDWTNRVPVKDKGLILCADAWICRCHSKLAQELCNFVQHNRHLKRQVNQWTPKSIHLLTKSIYFTYRKMYTMSSNMTAKQLYNLSQFCCLNWQPSLVILYKRFTNASYKNILINKASIQIQNYILNK